MRAVIVGSGDPVDPRLLKERCENADVIIAADGGGYYLYEAGITPDFLIGDFDSIPPAVLEHFRAQKRVTIRNFPAKKDFTDMELAVETAAGMGADEICILSATGSRLDHSAGNILLLSGLLDKNIRGWIEDANNRVCLTRGRIELERLDNWKVSLIALSPEVRGLTTEGLSYPLKDYTLKLGSCLGISNEFASDTAAVSFDEGLLMVILSRDE
ncbi:MAG TPA: thiamine diphosphokinase [Thermoclostridium sp.]|nr:thiamine diphosphokinase [Clostridiaceae bacterium]HOQ76574.1 thiamine diphosphokinase [Thermoclostridium sp.]